MSEMMSQVSPTSGGDVNPVGALEDVLFRLGAILTGDGSRLRGSREDEVPVVEELMDDLAGLVDFQVAEFLDSLEVLDVERTETCAVESGVKHSMLFA